MADAPASGAGVRKGVGVQVPPRALPTGLRPGSIRQRPVTRSSGHRPVDVGASWQPGGFDVAIIGGRTLLTQPDRMLSSAIVSDFLPFSHSAGRSFVDGSDKGTW